MFTACHNILKKLGLATIVASVVIISNVAFAGVAGTVSAVTGYVTVTDSEGKVKRLQEGDKINEGDVVNTGAGAGVEFTLANGELVTLGELASYTAPNADGELIGSGSYPKRTLGGGSQSLSTATSAGGGLDTTPGSGASPL